MVARNSPRVEELERRDCPRGNPLGPLLFQPQIALSPLGTLTLVGTPGNDVLSTTVSTDGTQVTARANTLVRVFDASQITSIVQQGRSGNDDLTNRVRVPTSLSGGDGNDRVNDFSLQGSVSGGNGNDVLYAILGSNTVNPGPGADRVITNATSTFTRDARDAPPVVFGLATTPGFTLIDRVLYFVPTPGVDADVVLTLSAGRVLATANGVTQTFLRSQVNTFATVLGAGNDRVQNLVPGLNVVAYGVGGNDRLSAGAANFALLKGGGGDDVLDASGAAAADLTGDAGSDTLVGGRGADTLRQDALDVVFAGLGDRTLS